MKIIKDFLDKQEKGSYYHAIEDHVEKLSEKLGLEIPEEDFAIRGPLGKLYQDKKIVRLLVSEEVVKGWFGLQKWEGEKEKGRCKVYFSPQYQSQIQEITNLQNQATLKEDFAKGITPILRSKIVDSRFFDILERIAREKGYIDVVLLEKLKQYEIDMEALKEALKNEAIQTLTDLFADKIAKAYKRTEEIRRTLDEAEKVSTDLRKEAYEKSTSKNTAD
jgi:SOS response regulatory protein OraA/RecX